MNLLARLIIHEIYLATYFTSSLAWHGHARPLYKRLSRVIFSSSLLAILLLAAGMPEIATMYCSTCNCASHNDNMLLTMIMCLPQVQVTVVLLLGVFIGTGIKVFIYPIGRTKVKSTMLHCNAQTSTQGCHSNLEVE